MEINMHLGENAQSVYLFFWFTSLCFYIADLNVGLNPIQYIYSGCANIKLD